LVISDLVILSQHSHIDIPIAGNSPVRPIRYSDQVIYTRSITFPKFLAHYFLFNFNLHEAHHQYPSLPAYYLGSAIVDKSNAPGFIEYLKRYKSLSGMNFVFNTKDKMKTP
jgi:omega-6 fatty acid desaturase (delta-12 desaturase)